MKLRYSNTSPYVRKVMVTAIECGLDSQIDRIVTNPWSPDTDLPGDNPLSKIPALITEGGEHLYGSVVICEYLDSLHDGTKLFPPAGGARWTALRRHSLGDGILDAAVFLRIETVMRPAELRWTDWADRQRRAINRSLDVLENEAENLFSRFSIGEITILSALGYLDFRQGVPDWRSRRPRLSQWFAEQEQRPSAIATQPHE
jgi:glutathione S-transferase